MDLLEALNLHKDDFDEMGRDYVFELGDKILNNHSGYSKPSFSYNYLNIGTVSAYCFNHSDFSLDDYHKYFKYAQQISKLTYDELLSDSKKIGIDFKIYNKTNSALINAFKTLTGNRNLLANQTPTFGRIGLYNSTATGGKAPRIFFFVGHHCMLHILFYDPYHQLYPDTTITP